MEHHSTTHSRMVTVMTELLLHSSALEQRGNDNRTPLLRAAFGGHEATVGHLLATGADPDATTRHATLLINAIDSGLTRLATTFIRQMNETALNYIIKHKRFPIAQAIFDRGIGHGTSHPVVRTILRSRPEELQMLLLHGVEVKWLRDDTDMLCVACKSGQCEIFDRF
ncbi:hypothetical protein Q9L58_001931 [Maublancomyces gigas]|uniref:Ankyrin repeat protein n=1 Tax=Discina gigas TaxID=1032678 RepID=A0ABR3GSY1_9PEZI